ncbi:MAG: T9SS type A sorting domain-containing protein [Flavobacteriales bacterium]
MKKSLLLVVLMSGLVLNFHGQVQGTPIYNFDFADGIPTDWDNGIISTNNIAQWEYRGPSTDPDVTVGARGSCAIIAQPISSETASNGFVIFDGNYWDDGTDECGNLGTGVDPAPHTAWLSTGPLDFSTNIGAVITFQQQYRHFQNTTKVQVSNDGGNVWNDVLTNPTIQSPQVEWASVNISAYTIGQTDVRIRFLYTGTYYWWLLDDITIYEPNANDMKLTRSRYANNLGIGSSLPYNDLEYDQYPSIMIPPFTIKATAQNIGAYQQTGVKLNTVIVQDGITQTYTANSPTASVNSGINATFNITPTYTNPAVLGEYEIIYTIQQNQTDDNLQNNKDTLDYTISTYAYARDEGPMENEFLANPYYVGLGMTFEAGNFFQARSSNKTCHSIGVAFGESTQPGALVKGIIYKEDMEQIWAQTDLYTVNIANLNDTGEEHIVNIPLLNDLTLINDSIYFVVIQQQNVEEVVSIVRSGAAPEEMSIVRYPEVNASFYFLKTPVVRMNIFNPSETPGCTDTNASNFLPAATINDGSCLYPGCSNEIADNYDPNVNFDNGSCQIGGCNDPLADNFDPIATYNNNTCQYLGCTDPAATNFDPIAVTDDGTCLFLYALFNVDQTEGCAPLTINITNQTDVSPEGICNFQINNITFENDCVSELVYTFNNPGEYTITYSYDLNGEVTETSATITVLANPNLNNISYDPASFSLVCPGCSGENLEWTLDGEVIEGATDFTLSTFMDGAYQNGFYQLSSYYESGCAQTADPIYVLQPYFTIDPIEACIPLEAFYTNLTDEVTGTTSVLDFGDGTVINSPIDEISHFFTTAETFTITLSVSNEFGSGSYSVDVTALPNLEPVIEENNGFVECLNCDQFASVTWDINGEIFTGNGPYPSEEGTYSVTGVTANGCSGESSLTIDAIAELNGSHFRVYPVPSNGLMTIENLQFKVYDLFLFNSMGQLVLTKSNQSGNQNILNLSHLASGIYTLKLNYEGQWYQMPIQILHD